MHCRFYDSVTYANYAWSCTQCGYSTTIPSHFIRCFFLFGLFNACSFRFCVNPRINEAMKTVLIGQFEYKKNSNERIKTWIQSVSGVVKVNSRKNAKELSHMYVTRHREKTVKQINFLSYFVDFKSLITVGFPFPIWIFYGFQPINKQKYGFALYCSLIVVCFAYFRESSNFDSSITSPFFVLAAVVVVAVAVVVL